MSARKRVAVIGAGVSGLAAIKSCLEEGVEPVCFEQTGDIGGLWSNHTEQKSTSGVQAYNSLITNTSKDVMSFSDFTFSRDLPTYLTSQMVYDYLKRYAHHFDLTKHIQFNTKVSKVLKAQDYDVTGRWEVETEVSGECQSALFDAVIVGAGFYTIPKYPNVEGLEDFKGLKEHSFTFKTGENYRKKRILVVGNSNSAGDVAVDISNFAEQVYLSVGSGTWVLTRLGPGAAPRDMMLRRFLFCLPEKLISNQIMKIANGVIDHVAVGLRADKPLFSSPAMVNDELPMNIMNGKVKVFGTVVRFGAHEAEFDNGEVIKNLDGVIFATGYNRDFSFLDPSIGKEKEKVAFYKMTFPIQLQHKTLALIGYLSTVGPVPPIIELQTRLAARVFAGEHKLPPQDVMMKDVEKWNKYILRTKGRYKYQFPNIPFRDEIAGELGLKPSWWNFLTEPRLVLSYYFGPALPFHHRLWGPGACREGAEKAYTQALNSYYPKQQRWVRPPQGPAFIRNFFILIALMIGILCALVFTTSS